MDIQVNTLELSWARHESFRSQTTLSRPPNGPHETVSTKDDGGIFGGLRVISGVPVTPNQETLHFVRVCALIFYVLFREPQLLDASSDRGDSDGAGISRKVEQKMTG